MFHRLNTKTLCKEDAKEACLSHSRAWKLENFLARRLQPWWGLLSYNSAIRADVINDVITNSSNQNPRHRKLIQSECMKNLGILFAAVKKCNFLPEGSGEELQKSLFNNFKEPLKEKIKGNTRKIYLECKKHKQFADIDKEWRKDLNCKGFGFRGQNGHDQKIFLNQGKVSYCMMAFYCRSE